MSAFVLNRNYELQLPNSYVDVDRDEMEYVDGGALRLQQTGSIYVPSWVVNTIIGAGIVAGAVALGGLCVSLGSKMALAIGTYLAHKGVSALNTSFYVKYGYMYNTEARITLGVPMAWI